MFPFDFSSLFDNFKDNIDIRKEADGIVIIFKNPQPGMNVEMMKNMLENAMNMQKGGMFKDFMGMGGDEELDEMEKLDYEPEDMGEFDESPLGFKAEVIEDGKGIKLIPDDPADLDEMYENFKRIFDPEFFKGIMESFMKFFGGGGGGLFGQDPVEGDDQGGDDDSDSNVTNDYFYT